MTAAALALAGFLGAAALRAEPVAEKTPSPNPCDDAAAPEDPTDTLEEARARRTRWTRKELPHFKVCLESRLAPRGFELAVERLHGRMRIDLAPLAPWMDKEPIELVLFKDHASYLRSNLEPPQWSDGLSLVKRRLVAVFEKPDREAVLRVVAHETTHVLFESFFKDSKAGEPPTWLTEGLAMLMETESSWLSSETAPKSPWQRAHDDNRQTMRILPLAQFLQISPDQAKTTEAVDDWYLQAYSVVRYLVRHQGRPRFKQFCADYRDTADVTGALTRTYNYRSIADFERSWKRWLNSARASKGRSGTGAYKPKSAFE